MKRPLIRTSIIALFSLLVTSCAVPQQQSINPETFSPTTDAPRCYTEGGMTQIVTGEATAQFDEAGTIVKSKPLAIGYNPEQLQNSEGTGWVAIWADPDDRGRFSWSCKEVREYSIKMKRGGIGATLTFKPEQDGKVRKFNASLHRLYSFTFTRWRDITP